MGLDDLVPEEKKDTSSSSSRAKSKTPEEQEDKVVIGQGDTQKVFDEDFWEDVQKVLKDDMELNPSEVVNNYPAEKRYDKLHEAALRARDKLGSEELERQTTANCDYCGKSCGGSCVTIAGFTFHIQHTVGQIEEVIKEET